MALPTSRNHTYAPGSQLFSADLNDLQDHIIGIVGGTIAIKRPARARKVPASAGQGLSSTGAPGAGSFSTSTGFWSNTGTTQHWLCPIEVEQGERLLSVTCQVQTTVSSSLTMALFRAGSSATATQLGGTQTSGSSGAQELVVSGLTESVVNDSDSYFVLVTSATANSQIVRSLRWSTDRP